MVTFGFVWGEVGCGLVREDASPRFKRLITAYELRLSFKPRRDEAEWAVACTDCDERMGTQLLALKSYQRIGCLPKLDEIPDTVVDFLHRAVVLPEGTVPRAASTPERQRTAADGARGLMHGRDVEQIEAGPDIALGADGGDQGEPRLAQHQRGGVQVAQGAHALFGGQVRRGAGQAGLRHVEDFDRLVRGLGALRGSERHQGGHPPWLGEVGDRAGADRGGVAGRGVQAAGGDGD